MIIVSLILHMYIYYKKKKKKKKKIVNIITHLFKILYIKIQELYLKELYLFCQMIMPMKFGINLQNMKMILVI